MTKTLLAAMLAFALGGCASIVGSPTQTIPITSTPSDASIEIVDETGLAVFSGSTPTSVTLNKSTGRYFGGKAYVVKIAKAGFKTQEIPVESRANGWYIGGNFVFGGLIGWLIVDPFSGSMYTLSPEAVAQTMNDVTAKHNNHAQDGSIAVMLVEDVPLALRDQMTRLR